MSILLIRSSVTSGLSQLSWTANEPSYLPVVPGLAGWGVETVGGSGRHLGTPATSIVIVDRLTTGAADGSQISAASGNQPALYRGSLRYAVERTFPRVILFETSGMYDMQRTQLIDNSYCTIAFQTAPSPGFFIKNGNLQCRQASDVLAWHMQVYNGDESTTQAVTDRRGFTFASGTATKPARCVLAWCSLYWGSDGNAAATQGGTDFTLAHCLLAEALANPIHPEYPQSHSFVADSETDRISLQRVLFAHAKSRNPLCRVLNMAQANVIRYNCKGASNIPSNSGSFGCDFQGDAGTNTQNNVIACYDIKGPNYSTSYGGDRPMYARGTDDATVPLGNDARLYLSFAKAHGWAYSSPADLVTLSGTTPAGYLAGARIDAAWPDGLRGMDPDQSGYINLCKRTIGARPKERAAGRDATIWQHVENRIAGSGSEGSIIEATSEVGGPFSVAVNTHDLFDNTDMQGDPLPFANFNAVEASGYTVGDEWQYRLHQRVTHAN